MLQLIKRCPEYAEGYKAYCQEAYDYNIVFFRPSNPKYLTDDWFMSTKDWYVSEKSLEQSDNSVSERLIKCDSYGVMLR